jgi:hypothetical protein
LRGSSVELRVAGWLNTGFADLRARSFVASQTSGGLRLTLPQQRAQRARSWVQPRRERAIE